MQFKTRKLLEDLNDDVVIEYDVNGHQFRFWNGKKYINIPKDSEWHQQLRDEYRTQKKIEQRKKEDPDFDLDAYKKADEERIMMDSHGDAILKKAEEQQRQRKDDSNYYKAGDRKTYQKLPLELNPDFNEMTQYIMSDFENNVLIPVKHYTHQSTTEVAHDPMDIGDEFFDDVDTRDILPTEIMELDDRTPFVLLYFDCSGSWDSVAKTKAREKLGTYFETLRDEGVITYEDKSFADTVNKKGGYVGPGSTYLKPVVQDIDSLTRGKLSNVIIITDGDFDSDMEGQTSSAPYITVDGMVWYIFINDYSTELPKHVKSDKDGWSKAFYFTSEKNLGDD